MTDPMQPDPQSMFRDGLVQAAQVNAAQPDAAAQAYERVGFDASSVSLLGGGQVSVSQLRPGDIVGWKGGHEPDGSYAGNLAVYAGNGEIIENFYGNNRRRKLDPKENTFGLHTYLPNEEQTGQVP